jgi:hypothetical protein
VAEQLGSLASRLVAEFKSDQRDREPLERRMLQDYRMYVSELDPETARRIKKGKSKLYINKARVKTDTVSARLMEILFPQAGDTNWEIRPTPEPQLDAATMQFIAAIRLQYGDAVAEETLQKEAKRRADAMTTVMRDQLAESPDRVAYRATIREVIRSGCIYGMGIHKGPLVDQRTRKVWRLKSMATTAADGRQVQREAWALDQSPAEMRPYFRSVSVWNFYWDMSAKRLKDCRRVWEEYLMSYGDVLDLATQAGFNATAIREYLGKFKDGDATERQYEIALREIGGKNAEAPKLDRFRVLERYGWLRGDELVECGVELGEDPVQQDYFCNVWLLGEKIIKAVRSPIRGVEYPFQIFTISKDESGICGQGIPRLYRHAQLGMNAMYRAMMDNARLSYAPIVGVNKSAFPQTEDSKDLHGGQVLEFDEDRDIRNAIAFFQGQSHTNDYLALLKVFDDAGDELTVPRWVHGDGNVSDAAKTLGGLSMLMSAMSINLAEMVKTFDDDVTVPFITALYFWNMDFNGRADIKGDYNVVALGSTALMAKEVQSQRLLQFLQLVLPNPQLSTMVDLKDILRQIAVAMQIPSSLVFDDATIQANQKQQMVMQAQAEQQSKLETLVNEMNSRGITPDQSLQAMLAQTLQQLSAGPGQAGEQPAASGQGAPMLSEAAA